MRTTRATWRQNGLALLHPPKFRDHGQSSNSAFMGTSHRSPLPLVSKLGVFFCIVFTILHSTFYNSDAQLAITPCVVYKTARAAFEAIVWPALRYLVPPSNVNPDCTASVPPRTFQTKVGYFSMNACRGNALSLCNSPREYRSLLRSSRNTRKKKYKRVGS